MLHNLLYNFFISISITIFSLLFFSIQLNHVSADDASPNEFSPQVSATCKAGVMNIKVAFNNTYSGAIHSRDFRTPQCMQFGDGSKQVSLSLNLLAKENHPDYCGILVHNVSADVRSFTINQFYWLFTPDCERI